MIWGISLDWPNKKNYFISWAWDLISAFRLWSSEDSPLVPILVGFSGGSGGKESTRNVGDLGLIPGMERSPGEGNGNPLSIIAWEISWTEEPGGLQSIQPQLDSLRNQISISWEMVS